MSLQLQATSQIQLNPNPSSYVLPENTQNYEINNIWKD